MVNITLHIMMIKRAAIHTPTIVLYSRDHKGVGHGPRNNITQKPASIFPDDDETVLVR